MKIDPLKPHKIAEDTYWIGWPDESAGFSNNPYLIVDDPDYIIFDPGSGLDLHWQWVKNKIEQIIPIEKINLVIVHHQDPDLCAAIPKLEKELGIGNFDILTTDRTGVFIPYYNVKTEITYVSDRDIIEVGSKGRQLEFITTPYLHFPGAMVTYDHLSKILFSSDIFGGFSVDWSLYANKYYFEAMKAFLQPYMSAQKHVHNFLDKIKDLEIDLIAPQHGSIIQKELVNDALEMFRNLEVGIWK